MAEKNAVLRRGTAADREDILDFGNYVFNTDFRSLLPKLYGEQPPARAEKLAASHVLVTEKRPAGERLRAMVGSFKIALSVAGQPILVRGIGTVSVHPYDRGKGYMKAAMNRAIDDARAEGADMMALSGRKQRYQHYGFDKCATRYEFVLTPTVSGQLRRFGVEGITLPVARGNYTVVSGEAAHAYEADCRALYESQQVYALRENFRETAGSWRCELYVVLRDGAFAGYATLGNAYGGYTANELLLVSAFDENGDGLGYIPAVLALLDAATAAGASGVQVLLQPFQTGLIRCLTMIAESGSIAGGCALNVFHYARVVQAFLQVKASYEPLMDGSWVFLVRDQNEAVRVTVKNGQVFAQDVPADTPADLALLHLQMMNFLFSPTGQAGFHGAQPALEKSWFPIPVCFSEQDNV